MLLDSKPCVCCGDPIPYYGGVFFCDECLAAGCHHTSTCSKGKAQKCLACGGIVFEQGGAWHHVKACAHEAVVNLFSVELEDCPGDCPSCHCFDHIPGPEQMRLIHEATKYYRFNISGGYAEIERKLMGLCQGTEKARHDAAHSTSYPPRYTRAQRDLLSTSNGQAIPLTNIAGCGIIIVYLAG